MTDGGARAGDINAPVSAEERYRKWQQEQERGDFNADRIRRRGVAVGGAW